MSSTLSSSPLALRGGASAESDIYLGIVRPLQNDYYRGIDRDTGGLNGLNALSGLSGGEDRPIKVWDTSG